MRRLGHLTSTCFLFLLCATEASAADYCSLTVRVLSADGRREEALVSVEERNGRRLERDPTAEDVEFCHLGLTPVTVKGGDRRDVQPGGHLGRAFDLAGGVPTEGYVRPWTMPSGRAPFPSADLRGAVPRSERRRRIARKGFHPVRGSAICPARDGQRRPSALHSKTGSARRGCHRCRWIPTQTVLGLVYEGGGHTRGVGYAREDAE